MNWTRTAPLVSSWLAETRHWLAGAVLPVFLLVLVGTMSGDAEARVRLAGFLATASGIGAIVMSVYGLQEQLGRPSIAERLARWARQFPPFAVREAPVDATAVSLAAWGAVSSPVPAARSRTVLKERMTALEDRMQALGERLRVTTQALRTDIDATREEVQRDIETLRRDLAQLQRSVETVSIGRADWQYVGALWLITGQACLAFAPELARLVG